jgi:hypothetical protein
MENVFARREKFSIETEKNNKPLFEDQNMLYDLVVVLFVIDYYNQPLIVINLVEYYSIISKQKDNNKKINKNNNNIQKNDFCLHYQVYLMIE